MTPLYSDRVMKIPVPIKEVKDMLAFILQTAVQSAAQDTFHTLDNKIGDFHQGI